MEENKRDRKTYIGGSDVAGLLGMSRWDTPLSVWAEKTGQYIKPEVESEAAELGRELEDYVAKRFARKTGKVVVRAGDTFFHPGYPFLGANVDRLIEAEDAGLEVKTCSAWKAKEWEGQEIPQEYILQCYHYMGVTGRKKWYIAVLIGNQEFKWREILWDDKIMANLLEKEVTFWTEYVDTLIMPAQIMRQDTDVLAGLFPVAETGKIVQLGDATNQMIETLIANKEDLRALENQIEQNENSLKAQLGDAEIGTTSLYRVAWTNSKWSGLDGKALKETHPDIHAQFYKSKPIRKFNYKPLTEDK